MRYGRIQKSETKRPEVSRGLPPVDGSTAEKEAYNTLVVSQGLEAVQPMDGARRSLRTRAPAPTQATVDGEQCSGTDASSSVQLQSGQESSDESSVESPKQDGRGGRGRGRGRPARVEEVRVSGRGSRRRGRPRGRATRGARKATVQKLESSEDSDGSDSDESLRREAEDDIVIVPRKIKPFRPVKCVVYPRSRGVADSLRQEHHARRLDQLAGPGLADRQAVLQAAVLWERQPCLPRRATFHFPLTHTAQIREWEATEGWQWYDRGHALDRQRRSGISAVEALEYLAAEPHSSCQVLMGSDRQCQVYANKPFCVQADDNVHAGWILFFGAKVHCLDWTPNCAGHQYLAVTTKHKSDSTWPADRAPAFTPALPSLSSVQIWQFFSRPEQHPRTSTLDCRQVPRLLRVLCTDWSGIKQIRWCPMPRNTHETSLGLLGLICDDGKARVVDVPHTEESRTFYGM